ncbi:MAG TPA: T9SS type A sorting domain-containing protein [Bacteroidia bacterium]|nr:T9SS type A sorting domain-containing protein [Bacteroidia bacterium]
MKTKRFLLITLLLAGIFSKNSFAQQILMTVTSVDSFPVLPLDTAYENDQYNFNIHVSNLGSGVVPVLDTCRVFLMNTDTNFSTIETLGKIYIDTLHGNDNFSIPVFSYQFTPATYKTGNNIVVVWPRINSNPGATFDSLQIDTVYFVPLLSINMLSEQIQSFFLFPNPVTDQIRINSNHQNSIEYVRISNDLGQTVMFRRSAGKNLDVRFLSKGFYFIEITERNGTVSRKKFLKL